MKRNSARRCPGLTKEFLSRDPQRDSGSVVPPEEKPRAEESTRRDCEPQLARVFLFIFFVPALFS